MAASDNRALQIGDWRVDPALDEISRDGNTLKLEPRTMRVLICLAEHAGEVVSVEQLLDAVWKDVVVTQDSVYQAVATLRRALGDDPKEPRYIANVLRRGYRLLAPVAAVSATRALPESAVQGGPPISPAPARLPVSSAIARLAGMLRPARREGRVRFIGLATAVVLLLAAFGAERLWQSKQRAPQTDARATLAQSRSVAVLPFLDLSENKDQQYFADGMTEEVIELLSRSPDLRVPARTSSFYFKDKRATIGEMAQALGVAHLLEGSVRKSGDQLRLTVQLIRADSGYHIWAASYDRKLGDLFATQDEIAGAVVGALKASLIESMAPSGVPTADPEAHTLYLQALSLWNRGTPEDNNRLIEYLKRALALDPGFAKAWALLAQAQVEACSDYAVVPCEAVRAEAFHAAQQALALDPNLADAHRAMAHLLQDLDWNLAGASAETQRALALDPGNALALRIGASILMFRGRLAEAEALAREGVVRDPVNNWSYYALGLILWNEGHFAEAEQAMRQSIELNPTADDVHVVLAAELIDSGRVPEAAAEFDQDLDTGEKEIMRPLMLEALGQHAEAERQMALVEKKYGSSAAHEIAIFYAYRREPDAAFAWLDRAYQNHEKMMLYVKTDPYLRNLHSDPRFSALVQRMKIPD